MRSRFGTFGSCRKRGNRDFHEISMKIVIFTIFKLKPVLMANFSRCFQNFRKFSKNFTHILKNVKFSTFSHVDLGFGQTDQTGQTATRKLLKYRAVIWPPRQAATSREPVRDFWRFLKIVKFENFREFRKFSKKFLDF